MRHSRGPRSSHPIFGRQLFQRKQWARLHRVAQSFISGIGAGRLKREKITQPSSNPLLVSSPCSRLLKIIGRSQGWKHDSLSLSFTYTRSLPVCTGSCLTLIASSHVNRSRFTRDDDARLSSVCGSRASYQHPKRS